MKIDRRDFLKKAGLGSIALVSVPALTNTLATPTWADEDQDRVYDFVAFSKGATISGVDHRIGMRGAGSFQVEAGKGKVKGGGSFVHFNNASPIPKAILAFGTWEPTEFVSFFTIGTYGLITAGILETKINLTSQEGTVVPATLRLICNIGAAGLSTGEVEGYKLAIPGAAFSPFVPLDPPLGLTHLGLRGLD